MKEQVEKTIVTKEFSRFAHTYDDYNRIQKMVAVALVKNITTEDYDTIIDFGCGSGSIYKNLQKSKNPIKNFIAVDASEEMLDLHPEGKNIKKICMNFDIAKEFDLLTISSPSLLISSSALQWSTDLNQLFRRLSDVSMDAYFAIFTSNTFKTLHRIASIDSPIYSKDVLQEHIDTYYRASYELKEYTLHFNNIIDIFRYIKKSGVSGGEKQLSYKEMKMLMQRYPLDYLEFEVLFVKATSRSVM